WSKVEHAARRPYSEPEIRQADLAGLALELAVWGTDAAGLPFLDPPPRRALGEARRPLASAGTAAPDRPLRRALPPGRPPPPGLPPAPGRPMVPLPLHPRLARMVLVAEAQRQ